MRGEHIGGHAHSVPSGGPSPRARGAPRVLAVHENAVGTIPACAGSTRRRPRPCSSPWDHPRVRGEHDPVSANAPSTVGPSPRARGALGDGGRRAVGRGTIPACAGSTRPRWWRCRSSRDHPRVRGEHVVGEEGPELARGPSPRARGALPGQPRHGRRRGTIPACAGSTTPRPFAQVKQGDHPRVRGEHYVERGWQVFALGPSPRARGALVEGHAVGLADGTIPACAGSTPDTAPARSPRRDHPRVRGEHAASSRAEFSE